MICKMTTQVEEPNVLDVLKNTFDVLMCVFDVLKVPVGGVCWPHCTTLHHTATQRTTLQPDNSSGIA